MHLKDTVYCRWEIKGGRGGEKQDKRGLESMADMFTICSNVEVFMATYSHHVSLEERVSLVREVGSASTFTVCACDGT